MIRHQPLGVALVLGPFNFPLHLPGGSNPWCCCHLSACPNKASNLDGGTTGVNGDPNLTGQGSLAPGSNGTLTMTDGAPSAPCFVGVSIAGIGIPLFGGVLHTNPADAILPLATDANGGLSVPFTWPPSATTGVGITFQVATVDASTGFGVSLSNGLRGVTP